MKKRQILNGMVYTEQCRFEASTLYFAGERIVNAERYYALKGEEERIDADGGYVIPGLTDIHFHGCAGSDCCDGTAEAFRIMAAYQARHGVTSITPATMTMPEEILTAAAHAAASLCPDGGSPDGVELPYDKAASLCPGASAAVIGLYMEGPFINAAKRGAQNAAFVREPDIAFFERLQKAADGKIRTVALAPEVPGAMEFIRALAGRVTISLAHTTADYDTVREALALGASQITHLYNAMPPYTHRAPGPLGAAADDPRCMVELICDGIHVHPAAVRTTFRIFGEERIVFISDSMRACGLPDGAYEFGGQDVTVKGRQALLADGTLAGSVTNLMDGMRTAVLDMGIPLECAVRCAAVNPARAIGISRDYGSLTPGKYANAVILDSDLEVRSVYLRGELVG